MKLIRILLFPFVPVYFAITWLRNWAYNTGVFSSKAYDFPIICVGNLSAGGTGKSPMVGYLISILITETKVATLSRGYGRETKGFVLAEKGKTFKDLGDESFQYFQNFGTDITVAVCENRQYGIENLLNITSPPEVIILDDAFQHRKVTAGLNILLTTYDTLFVDDFVLPTGNLREPKSGYQRAQIIVVTKCPEHLTESDKERIIDKINVLPNQSIYFSKINYSESIFSSVAEMKLIDLDSFTLVTGIANAKPLLRFLNMKGLEFKHLEYADHYNFTEADIVKMNNSERILTTEKDYMRLKDFEILKDKIFYLPIRVTLDRSEKFDAEIRDFVKPTL